MIQKIADFLAALISILPDDPILKGFEKYFDSISMYIGYINYFIPFDGMLSVLDVWAAGLFLYFVYVTNKDLIMKWINQALDAVKGLLSKLVSKGGE